MRARRTKIHKIKSDFKEHLGVVAAARVWESLDEQTQRTLVFEAAESRRDELLLAFPTLLSVGHGYRIAGQSRSSTGKLIRRGMLTQEPCLVLTVKRKWPKKRTGSRRGALPPFLMSFCNAPVSKNAQPTRVPCLIPIDVRGADEFKGRPHAPGVGQVAVVRNGRVLRTGAIACAVVGPGDSAIRGLTCYHVLVPPSHYGASTLAIGGLREEVFIGQDKLGQVDLNTMGIISTRGIEQSFDAALVAGVSRPAMLRACDDVRPGSSTTDASWIPSQCVVKTPRGDVPLFFVAEHVPFNRINYLRNGVFPILPRVIEFRSARINQTLGGDSGSAVLDYAAQNELVAMHLGGVEGTATTFALPAYLIFLNSSWSGGQSPRLAPSNW